MTGRKRRLGSPCPNRFSILWRRGGINTLAARVRVLGRPLPVVPVPGELFGQSVSGLNDVAIFFVPPMNNGGPTALDNFGQRLRRVTLQARDRFPSRCNLIHEARSKRSSIARRPKSMAGNRTVIGSLVLASLCILIHGVAAGPAGKKSRACDWRK